MSGLIYNRLDNNVCFIPYSLSLSKYCNSVHKDIPKVNLTNSIEFDRVYLYLYNDYNKLIVCSYENSIIRVIKIPMNYYDNRHENDILFYDENYGYDHENGTNVDTGTNIDTIKNIDVISIGEVFRIFGMIVLPNTGYYLENKVELINDLGYIPSDAIIVDSLESIKSQLFYNIMCQIFGDNEYNYTDNLGNKIYMVRNFRIISQDDNYIIASCEIYGNYLNFVYSKNADLI